MPRLDDRRALNGILRPLIAASSELSKRHAVTLHALPGLALMAFGLRTAWAVLRDAGAHDVLQGGDMAIWPLVWIARLRSPGARLALASQVLPQLPEPLELRVAGTVWDESERRALDQPRVRFLGSLPQAELAEAMARALAVVVPNIPAARGHFEGFGLVAVEAAAAGGVVPVDPGGADFAHAS